MAGNSVTVMVWGVEAINTPPMLSVAVIVSVATGCPEPRYLDLSVRPLLTSASLNVTLLPLNFSPSRLSLIGSYEGSPVIVTVVAVDGAGAVTLIPKGTVPPHPATVRDECAIESVGAVGAAVTRSYVTAFDVAVPAAFVSVAVSTLAPELASVTLADQLPFEATVAEPIDFVPSRTATVVPASASSTVPTTVWFA